MTKKISQITASEATSLADDDVFEGEEAGGTSFKYAFSVLKSTVAAYLAGLAQTLTNKRVTKRVVTTTQAAEPAINTDDGDIFEMTGLAQAITSLTTNLTGTPDKGDVMQMWITDDGTARAIAPGASFAGTAEFSVVGLTTTAGKRLMLLWEFTTVWELVGKLNQA